MVLIGEELLPVVFSWAWLLISQWTGLLQRVCALFFNILMELSNKLFDLLWRIDHPRHLWLTYSYWNSSICMWFRLISRYVCLCVAHIYVDFMSMIAVCKKKASYWSFRSATYCLNMVTSGSKTPSWWPNTMYQRLSPSFWYSLRSIPSKCPNLEQK